MIATELAELTREIQQDTGVDERAAAALAWEQLAVLLGDAVADIRYIPRRVVVFDLLTAQELKTLTDR
jgi:hypothetical protein